MRAYERFLTYAKVSTGADENSGVTPSSPGQWELARLLEKEMKELGLSDVRLDEQWCVLTGRLPATPGCENAPALGLIAHMDTAPDFSGADVEPILHADYDGGDVVLPKEQRVIRVSDFPFLAGLKGKTLITADGSTLLGADDKAGIAEIMTLCEMLIAEGRPHGELCIAFTPDEEIGEGPNHFDVPAFGAKYAYTVDGDVVGSIEYENFNAAGARIDITGVAVHPGSAKNIMENALLIAQEINSLLPSDAVPARTEGYEGFYHLDYMSGYTGSARMDYIIRDHDMSKFTKMKQKMEAVCTRVQALHPTAVVQLSIRDTYYNMEAQLADCMHLVDNAKKAAEMAGVAPTVAPIRGGTDGARLSFMGLPCPNLGTGGYNFHGPLECIAVEDMDKVVEILGNIVELYSK